MRKLGKKQMTLLLQTPLDRVPDSLAAFNLELNADGSELLYTYDTRGERTGITSLLRALSDTGIRFQDLQTSQSSLEDIFVNLLKEQG